MRRDTNLNVTVAFQLAAVPLGALHRALVMTELTARHLLARRHRGFSHAARPHGGCQCGDKHQGSGNGQPAHTHMSDSGGPSKRCQTSRLNRSVYQKRAEPERQQCDSEDEQHPRHVGKRRELPDAPVRTSIVASWHRVTRVRSVRARHRATLHARIAASAPFSTNGS